MEQDRILTGFTEIDNKIGGLINSNLICVASRPCMGKTTFALNIASNVAKNEIPVLIFSLNMSEGYITNKIINIESATSTNFSESIKNLILFEKNINILTSSLTIEDIENICRKSKIEKNIGLIIIDYLQLIKSTNGQLNRDENIIRKIKELAEELNIPIIILSQLSKSLEERENRRPILADFKVSSSIVNNADTIIFVYKDDYYNKNSEKKNIVEVIINKNGKTETIELADIRGKYVNLEIRR